MWYVNVAVTRLFDALVWPFKGWPAGGLLLVSVLAGVAMLLIFKLTSRQDRIRRAKDRVRAQLLAMRLYADDPAVVMASQRAALRANLGYLRWAAIPILFIFPPVILIMSQLNLRYGPAPADVGAPVVLVAAFNGVMDEDVRLTAPAGVEVETEALRVPYAGEAAWRLRGVKEGRYTLKLATRGYECEKEFVVGETGVGHVSARRVSGFFAQVLNPGEPPLAGGVKEVRINYRQRPHVLFGLGTSWVIVFFVISLVAAFAFKGVVKAEL